MSDSTRRDFAKGAALATAASYSKIMGANDRLRMGYIGVGNRGDQVHDAFLETGSNETVAVCDLREDYMDFAVKKSRAGKWSRRPSAPGASRRWGRSGARQPP